VCVCVCGSYRNNRGKRRAIWSTLGVATYSGFANKAHSYVLGRRGRTTSGASRMHKK
jgi:hypothetical protein